MWRQTNEARPSCFKELVWTKASLLHRLPGVICVRPYSEFCTPRCYALNLEFRFEVLYITYIVFDAPLRLAGYLFTFCLFNYAACNSENVAWSAYTWYRDFEKVWNEAAVPSRKVLCWHLDGTKEKGKLLCTMEDLWTWWDIAPFIIDLGTRCRRVLDPRHGRFTPGEEPSMPIE
jgi:hypothetical protein